MRKAWAMGDIQFLTGLKSAFATVLLILERGRVRTLQFVLRSRSTSNPAELSGCDWRGLQQSFQMEPLG